MKDQTYIELTLVELSPRVQFIHTLVGGFSGLRRVGRRAGTPAAMAKSAARVCSARLAAASCSGAFCGLGGDTGSLKMYPPLHGGKSAVRSTAKIASGAARP